MMYSLMHSWDLNSKASEVDATYVAGHGNPLKFNIDPGTFRQE